MPAPLDLLRRAPARPPLWTSDDVARLVLVDLLAVALLGIAFVMTDRQDAVADQLVWLHVGAGGLVVSGAANCRWLLNARNAVGRRRVRILVDDASWDHWRDEEEDLWDHDEVLVATPAGTVFHRGGCAMVDGRATTPGTATVHERAGRSPCPVCEP